MTMRHLVVATLMFSGIAIGCNETRTKSTTTTTTDKTSTTPSADDVATRAERERREAVDATAEQVQLEKQQYERKLEEGLNELDRKMADLSARIEEAQGTAKERLQAEWKELPPERERARERLDEIKNSSAAAWDDLKAGAQDAFSDLRKSVNQASDRFEEDEKK